MRSRTANISLTAELSLAGLASNFHNVVHETLAPLYELFVGFDATRQFVKSEIAEFQNAMLRLGHNPMPATRSEEHTSELQSLMRISYAVFCLKKKKKINHNNT